ncbi:MAG: hypothetical protein ABI196_24350 [Bradyrhizobium sp.]
MVALLGTETDVAAAKKTEGAATIAGDFSGAVKSILQIVVGEAGRADHLLLHKTDKQSIQPALKVS